MEQTELLTPADKVAFQESRSLWDGLKKAGRVLTFRITEPELLNLNRHDLLVGLLFTWIAGVGRYWDNGRAEILQVLGVGSVVYVFVLALYLWLIIWPLRTASWNYFRVLTYITLTAPPALLYAIPFQTIFPDPRYEAANTLNAWLLVLVSIWRVALLCQLLLLLVKMDAYKVVISTLMTLLPIVVGLTVLNLEHAVFTIMGGIINPSPHDVTYEILVLISILSSLAVVPVVILYIAEIVFQQMRKKRGALTVDETAD